MTALEIGLIQSDGVVWITLDVDQRNKIERVLLEELASCVDCIPIRVAAIHFCTYSSNNEKPADLLVKSIANLNNIRPNVHFGKLVIKVEADSSLTFHGLRLLVLNRKPSRMYSKTLCRWDS